MRRADYQQTRRSPLATLTPMFKIWVANDPSGTTWNPVYQSTNYDEADAVAAELAN